MGVLFFLNSKFPHEPNCGPFDSHQTPGAMIFDLQFDFKSYLAEGMDFFARIWLVVLLVLIFGVLMLVLRIVMARRTNDKVLEAMAETSHRQVEALHKEMFRLEQKADICRKRIDWIEKNHKKCASTMAWRLAATFLVSAVSADDVAVINLIRHGEKCDDSSSTGLTDIGKARAAYLARCMSQVSASDVMPFGKATAVMASAVRDGKSTRPRDTAQPLADRLHLPLQMPCDKEDPDCFAQHARGLLSANGAVVVSWQHQDIPALVKALKVPHYKDFKKWPDDCDIESFSEPACIDKDDRCYDQVWQVKFYRPVGSEWQAEAMTSWQEGFANDTGCHENLQPRIII
ncbi:unnamed protein product [Effrenium voratum]|nr:unnamed protein product [Effrenium voratum]